MHAIGGAEVAQKESFHLLRESASIRHRLYRLPRDPLVAEVLNPAFANSRSVVGAFGWFSSAWLASLAHGLARFISSGHGQRIQFVIAPSLFAADRELLTGLATGESWAVEKIARVLGSASAPDADTLERHAVECMGWMLQHGVLEVRVAIPRPDSNYHPKTWLFDDGHDRVLVRGSANATARGLGAAVEHMDVDCSWVDAQRVSQAIEMLDDWRSGRDEGLEAVIPLPVALRERLVALAPQVPPTLRDYERASSASGYGATPNPPPALRRLREAPRIPANLVWEEGRFAHQGRAVHAWESAGRVGLLEMATGAGKTKTALIAAVRFAEGHPGRSVVVISAPTKLLVDQWARECANFGFECIATTELSQADRSHRFMTAEFALRRDGDPRSWAVVCTNDFLKSQQIQTWLADKQDVAVLHIGDEAHSLGSKGCLQALDQMKPRAAARLGLSATPEREFDEDGTSRVWEYFGGRVFEFPLAEAIGVCLVPYDYHIRVAWLSDEEVDQFTEFSRKLGELSWASEEESAFGDRFRSLLIARKRLTECAEDKIRALGDLLREGLLEKGSTLFYASAKQPEQAQLVEVALRREGWRVQAVNSEENLSRQELIELLSQFDFGAIDGIVAKKMLDEGVDVPSVRQAVLVASSKSEREWIQRRGRVLRMGEGKIKATLVDIVALPSPQHAMGRRDLVKYVDGELSRAMTFGKNALNKLGICGDVLRLIREYKDG